jgi:2-methylcitrate dehydratase PrpD
LATASLAEEVEQKAATCLLDGLALGIAAPSDPTTTALLRSPLIAKDPGRCALWPNGSHVPLGDAVAINGYAVHARFQDDCDMTSWSHPGSLILPAAICVGEATDASLGRVLRGIVAGYSVLNWLGAHEVVGRAVVARSFRASPTLGPVGAAAAAAAVLGLAPEQAADAIAIAAASAGGVIDTVRSGSSDFRFQNGSASWRGAFAAVLAAEGVDGARGILESPKGLISAFAGLDDPVELQEEPDPDSILTVWAKPFPTLGDNVAVASAAMALSDRGIGPSEIEDIIVHQNAEFASYPGTSFRGPYLKPTQAIASTAFAVSAALSRGAITFDLYSDALEDPRILGLIEKLSVVPEPDYTYLDGKVVVRAGGEVYVSETSDLPRERFYRNAATATDAFETTVREVVPTGDLREFPAGLLERVRRGETEIPIGAVLEQAMNLRNQR